MVIEVYQHPIFSHKKDGKSFNFCADTRNNTKELKKLISLILLYLGKNGILNNFEKAIDLFKEKVVISYNKTLGKGVNHYFTKKLLKFSKQT